MWILDRVLMKSPAPFGAPRSSKCLPAQGFQAGLMPHDNCSLSRKMAPFQRTPKLGWKPDLVLTTPGHGWAGVRVR